MHIYITRHDRFDENVFPFAMSNHSQNIFALGLLTFMEDQPLPTPTLTLSLPSHPTTSFQPTNTSPCLSISILLLYLQLTQHPLCILPSHYLKLKLSPWPIHLQHQPIFLRSRIHFPLHLFNLLSLNRSLKPIPFNCRPPQHRQLPLKPPPNRFHLTCTIWLVSQK